MLHRFGYPGSGKSRLMVALAEKAVEMGRRVFFVGSDVHDLGAALRRVGTEEPLVLLWDDYRGDQPDNLRVFLGLDDLPGLVVKRVITSWPTINPLGEKSREPHFAKAPLGQVVPYEVLAEYTRKLLPQVSADEATHIVRLAEGHPQAVLLAAERVLSGTAPHELPSNLLEDAYDRLIGRALAVPGLGAEAVRRALLALALTGWVDYARPEHAEAFARAGVDPATLGALAEADLVARREQAYALHLDGFRAHVVRRSLDFEHPQLLSGTPATVAQRAAPLLEHWVDAIWGVCVLATRTTEYPVQSEALRKALLALLSAMIVPSDKESALRYVSRVVTATAAEPMPRVREELAQLITEVRKVHRTSEVAVEEARALFNATSGEVDPDVRLGLAERIGELRAIFDIEPIAVQEANALYNATVRTDDPEGCVAIANRIEALRRDHDTFETALAEAASLYNATVGQADAGLCAHLVQRISRLHTDYSRSELAELLARAIVNLSKFESDHECRLKLAHRIGRLREDHDTPKLAEAHARALCNATVGEPLPERCVDLADQIRQLRRTHDTPEIALLEAQSLCNATVGEPAPGRCADLAAEIGRLRERHETAEIALAQAEALKNAASVEQAPEECLALADRIAGVRNVHDTPEIATHEAFALGFAASRKEDSGWCFRISERIGRLRARHEVKEIALAEAFALEKAMEVETDEGRAVELRRRVEELAERYGLMEGEGEGGA